MDTDKTPVVEMSAVRRLSGTSVARFDETQNAWTIDVSLSGSGPQCLALDPADPETVYVELTGRGVMRTSDGKRT